MKKPVIGLVPLVDTGRESLWMLPGYMDGIREAGGLPVMLPLNDDSADVAQMVEICDGILFTGGHDVNPELYGEKNEARREHDYPGVVLTTAHSSKGLEWPVVFASLSKFDEEKNNMHILGGKHALEREERRRLLFVTATRARDELYITSRYIAYGQKGSYTYNLFLEDSYDCMGEVFNVSAIEAEAAAIAKEQASKRKAERAKIRAQLDELVAKGKE